MQRQPTHRPSALQLLCVPTVLRHAAEQGLMHMLPAEAKVNAAAALPPPAAEPAAVAAAAARDGARAAPGALSCARERAANEVRRGAREACGQAAGAGEGGGRLSPRGGHAGAAVVRQSSVPVISARPRVQAGPFP